MPVICLVRHAQASFGAADYDVLSPLGHEQAGVVAAVLAERKLRDPVVVCGTLLRQRDTAAALTAALGLPDAARQDERWNEYDSLELIARYTTAEQRAEHTEVQPVLDIALGNWADDPDGTWPGFAGGALAALEELAASLGKGRDAVVVTSGGILAAVCSGLLSAGTPAFVALNRVVVNAAITTLAVGASGTSLISFNEHTHFTGPQRPMLTYR